MLILSKFCPPAATVIFGLAACRGAARAAYCRPLHREDERIVGAILLSHHSIL